MVWHLPKLESSMKDCPKQIVEEIAKAKKLLIETEKEIASTFKLQMSTSHGTETLALTAAHLEMLGTRKKTLKNHIESLETFESNRADIGELRENIETKMLEFKKGFWKSTPATKRRTLRRLLEKLVLVSNGLEVFFRVDECGERTGNQPFEVSKRGKILKFEKKKQPKTVLPGAESDLSLLSENLLIDWNGWGGRTRTCE